MMDRIWSWLRGGARPEEATAARGADGHEIPAGALLLNGGVDFAFEVVGQAGHQGSLETIFRDHAEGEECRVIAAIVPDRQNDYDPSAIDVSICGLTVARFSREDGKKYRRVIGDVASRGLAVCRASIRMMPGPEGGARAAFRLTLDLAAPEKAAPAAMSA